MDAGTHTHTNTNTLLQHTSTHTYMAVFSLLLANVCETSCCSWHIHTYTTNKHMHATHMYTHEHTNMSTEMLACTLVQTNTNVYIITHVNQCSVEHMQSTSRYFKCVHINTHKPMFCWTHAVHIQVYLFKCYTTMLFFTYAAENFLHPVLAETRRPVSVWEVGSL